MDKINIISRSSNGRKVQAIIFNQVHPKGVTRHLILTKTGWSDRDGKTYKVS